MRTKQAPLKVDPQTDELISHMAHFLGVTKKELVAEAVVAYRDARREELRGKLCVAAEVLDGTDRGRLSMLTGISKDRIDELGGVDE